MTYYYQEKKTNMNKRFNGFIFYFNCAYGRFERGVILWIGSNLELKPKIPKQQKKIELINMNTFVAYVIIAC